MSGLVSFLKAFFPSTDSTRSNENDYNESLTTIIRSEDSPHAVDVEPPPTDPRTETLVKWREERNEFLRGYMESRMISQDNEEEDEEVDNDEEYVVPDNDEIDAPFWNDSHDSQPTGESSSARSPLPIRRKKIPHIDETVHVAKTLSALDLYTREFHLSLGRLEKAWDLRSIHRREWMATSRFEDDGPLGTLFKQVLCIEVTQLLQKENHVSQAALAAFGGAHRPERLRIFFYNKYAAQVVAFLDQAPGSKVLISCKNIPARCILPLTLEGASWYDEQGLAQYCLCIGDKSSMKLEEDGRLIKVHFDGPDLQVTLARVPSANYEASEVDISPASVSNMTLKVKETPSLESAYQEWEKTQRESEEKRDDEDMTENPPQHVRATAGSEHASSTNKVRSAEATSDNRNAKRAKTEVKYYTLDEVRSIHETQQGGSPKTLVKNNDGALLGVNLYGAVLGFTAPTLTKAHDWMVNIMLVDESTPLPTNGEGEKDSVAATSLVIFCRERDQLPRLLKAGDILRLHRVVVQEWKGDIQLLGRRSSSYVVIRPKNSESDDLVDDWSIIPTAKSGTTFGTEDTERAAALWHWAQSRLASHATLKASTKVKLSNLSRQDQRESTETHGDLTVMVSAILPVPEALKTASTPLGFLRVWDGTGTPTSDPLPLASAAAGAAVKNGDPPCEALQSIASVIESMKSADVDNRNDTALLEPPKCLCGRVANVAIWEEPHWDLVREVLRVGSFIRLRNVHDGRMYDGLLCLMVSSKSWLTPLPNNTFEIRELLKEHQQRVFRKDPFNPQSGVLPLDGEAAPAAAMAPAQVPMDIEEPSMDIAQDDRPATVAASSIARCISEAAPSSFQVKFRITGTIPSAQGLRDLCRTGPSENEIHYQFAVHISDETGEINAIVPNEIGEVMFHRAASDACEIPTPEATAIISDITRDGTWWKGEIRSVELNGCRFFILYSLSTA